MQLRPDELQANGFVLLETLEHKDLIPFVRRYLRPRTAIARVYYAANLVLVLVAVWLFIRDLQHHTIAISDWFARYCLGFALAFLLVPLHEYIHVLAYRWQGAKRTSYDYDLRRFYFMALADHFVANEREFRVVALAPFVVISAILLGLLPFVSHDWALSIWGVLFCHTAMCSGDFGLLGYFESHRSQSAVTYDDVAHKISYFYGKPTQPNA